MTAKAITINPYAGAITGPNSVTAGASVTMSEPVAGGTWSVGNSAIATINSSGMVTGISMGATTISYTVTGVCGSASATKPFTVGYCVPVRDSARRGVCVRV